NKALDRIQEVFLKTGLKPVVISTLIDSDVIEVIKKSDALVLDAFEMFLPALEKEFSIQHSLEHIPSHRIKNEKVYDARIEAVDFSLLHDDGLRAKHYNTTDVILIGVSRSGKTPTSLYMALQFGLKAANYPITEEDMDSEKLPDILRDFKGKCFGLTTKPVRLHKIRQERLPDSRYASLDQCKFEIEAVEAMFLQHQIPFINTASMSVEEIATKIVAKGGLHRL
ncbi:MAG: kinase/pyrophosphorylase, partial [Gammaproteobacteria bacterium]|nr:kinase/pyrophosphorylase [Gammaproteobacteria bacterium]